MGYKMALPTGEGCPMSGGLESGNTSGLSNSPKGITTAVPKDKYEISGSTIPKIVIVNTYSPSLVSHVADSEGDAATEVGLVFSISRYPLGATGQELTKTSEKTDADGLAKVLLKLGDIPAEYGVTATCSSCEASASSVTFTCCGKLQNDDFKQFDLLWGTTDYDSICSTVPADSSNFRPVYSCDAAIFTDPQYQKYKFSIRAKGCGLSALATVNNYYRNTYSLPIASTTPRALNTYLQDNNGYSTGEDDKGAVRFNKVKSFSGSHIDYLGATSVCTSEEDCAAIVTRDDLIKAINKDLAVNNPVIIRVPGHFMLVVGKCGAKYIVSDPGSIHTVLYDPNGDRKLIGIRQFKLLNIP